MFASSDPAPEAPPAIGLLGDVMLGRGVADELALRRPEELWDRELRALLGSLDLVICNLECCVSQRGRPTSLVPGKPFFFRGPPAAVDSLRAIGVRAVGLANNHALDFGEQALSDTRSALEAAGIVCAGAGLGPGDARRSALARAGPRRVRLVTITDHPVEYAAAPGRWGVAHADLRRGPPNWLLGEIAAGREGGDLVVAFPHWGPNMTTAPARWQRQLARELQAAGATIVAGHSAHAFHGIEWTATGPVVYDLGDALDDYRVDPALRNDLGLLVIWRPGAGDAGLELVGLRLRRARTSLASGADADWIAARLERACGELGTRIERLEESRLRAHPG